MKINIDPTQANTIYTLFTSNSGEVTNPAPISNGFIIFYSVNGVNVSDVIFLLGSQSSVSYWFHHTGGFTVTQFLTFFPNSNVIQVDDISS